ncbi:MAG: hypothetical protein AUJ20_09760 [Comamonadaceae bacterium CG1_02_60_18]|nr:MAG: hypothetical protein AUJ20_09760 [Comamonadaceae bacterium CG1_02_60_18]
MESTSVGERDGKQIGASLNVHVTLNVFPKVEGLASSKRADVMPPFQQDAVLQSVSDGAAVVLDANRQLICGEIGTRFFDLQCLFHDLFSFWLVDTLGSQDVLSNTFLIS